MTDATRKASKGDGGPSPDDNDVSAEAWERRDQLLGQAQFKIILAMSDEERERFRRTLPGGDKPVLSADEMIAGAMRKLEANQAREAARHRATEGANDAPNKSAVAVPAPVDTASDLAEEGGPVGRRGGRTER